MSQSTWAKNGTLEGVIAQNRFLIQGSMKPLNLYTKHCEYIFLKRPKASSGSEKGLRSKKGEMAWLNHCGFASFNLPHTSLSLLQNKEAGLLLTDRRKI